MSAPYCPYCDERLMVPAFHLTGWPVWQCAACGAWEPRTEAGKPPQKETTVQFRRTDLSDGAEETLTIVESSTHYYSTWLDTESPYIVQVTQGDHFSGLFDLDGDAISVSPPQWWIPAEIPAEVLAAVEEGWASGNYTVERQP